jgi:hypothetical protein
MISRARLATYLARIELGILYVLAAHVLVLNALERFERWLGEVVIRWLFRLLTVMVALLALMS